MNIEIYSKDNCTYCNAAIQVAQQVIQESDHELNIYKLDTDFNRNQLISMFPTAKSYPQIKIDNVSIGGYEELVYQLRERKWKL